LCLPITYVIYVYETVSSEVAKAADIVRELLLGVPYCLVSSVSIRHSLLLLIKKLPCTSNFFSYKGWRPFLFCISPVHMGPWSVRGRYQAMQGVSRHSTRMDSTDKSGGGTEFRTHDIAALDSTSGTLPMRHRLTHRYCTISFLLYCLQHRHFK
jgi:hypothetical protein